MSKSDKGLAHIAHDLKQQSDAIVSARRELPNVHDHDLQEAWEWVRDISALLRVRKAADRLLIEANRLEVEMLIRIENGSGEYDLSVANRTRGRFLVTVDPSRLATFLADIGPQQLAGQVLELKRELETVAHRLHREQQRIDRMAWAADHVPESPIVPEGVKEAARTLLETIAERNSGTTVDDITVALADELETDPDDPVVRTGLSKLIIEAAGAQRSDSEHVAYSSQSGVQWHSQLVESAAYRNGDGWVRMPWKAMRLTHLRFLAELREKQAVEMRHAANQLDELMMIVEECNTRLSRDDESLCEETIRLAKLESWVTSEYVINDKIAFPRFLAESNGGSMSDLPILRAGARLDAQGLTDDDLTPIQALKMLSVVDTGENRQTLLAFIRAYCGMPRVITDQVQWWPIGRLNQAAHSWVAMDSNDQADMIESAEKEMMDGLRRAAQSISSVYGSGEEDVA